MLHLRIFGLEFDKVIAIFEINALKFPDCKVWCKIKTLKVRTKNTLFGYL